ncbi:MAG: CHAD domain-containing protein [Kofleriaceae bacterium]
MATSETRDSETTPYAEHDKLGPLGSRASALHDPNELRAKLIGEFNSAVHAAREAAAAVEHGSAAAVHASRKALRRARAVLIMISSALPKSERRAVKSALQEARRSLSMIRDHSVAPETLGALPLSDSDRDTAKRVLDSAAEAIPPIAEIKQLLGEAAARAAAQAEALQAALPGQVTWDDVVYGIRNVYADARRALRAGKVSKQWFHSWRRRSKELACALDFVARQAGPRLQAIHGEIDGITDTLGPAVDLIMVREFVETHGVSLSPDAVSHLRHTIDTQLADLMKIARKAGRDLFDLKAKKFEKRLTKAVRRDLTPLDEDRTNGHLAD